VDPLEKMLAEIRAEVEATKTTSKEIPKEIVVKNQAQLAKKIDSSDALLEELRLETLKEEETQKARQHFEAQQRILLEQQRLELAKKEEQQRQEETLRENKRRELEAQKEREKQAAEVLAKQKALEAEMLRQKQQIEAARLADQANLLREAQEWLAQLKPKSEEGKWFERFASRFPSKLEAAVHYIEAKREVDGIA